MYNHNESCQRRRMREMHINVLYSFPSFFFFPSPLRARSPCRQYLQLHIQDIFLSLQRKGRKNTRGSAESRCFYRININNIFFIHYVRKEEKVLQIMTANEPSTRPTVSLDTVYETVSSRDRTANDQTHPPLKTNFALTKTNIPSHTIHLE